MTDSENIAYLLEKVKWLIIKKNEHETKIAALENILNGQFTISEKNDKLVLTVNK